MFLNYQYIMAETLKPKIIIVDENDQIINYKERKLIEPTDIYRVSALWLKNTKNEFLLAQRALKKKNNPGQWGPAVAGTVEEDETYESNITKEAEEELGLKNVIFTLGPKLRKRGSHHHFTQWYFLTLDKKISDFTIQREEVENIKWFTKSEFLQMYNTEPNIFLDNINEYIKLFN